VTYLEEELKSELEKERHLLELSKKGISENRNKG
jgi:hypothetical protein